MRFLQSFSLNNGSILTRSRPRVLVTTRRRSTLYLLRLSHLSQPLSNVRSKAGSPVHTKTSVSLNMITQRYTVDIPEALLGSRRSSQLTFSSSAASFGKILGLCFILARVAITDITIEQGAGRKFTPRHRRS